MYIFRTFSFTFISFLVLCTSGTPPKQKAILSPSRTQARDSLISEIDAAVHQHISEAQKTTPVRHTKRIRDAKTLVGKHCIARFLQFAQSSGASSSTSPVVPPNIPGGLQNVDPAYRRDVHEKMREVDEMLTHELHRAQDALHKESPAQMQSPGRIARARSVVETILDDLGSPTSCKGHARLLQQCKSGNPEIAAFANKNVDLARRFGMVSQLVNMPHVLQGNHSGGRHHIAPDRLQGDFLDICMQNCCPAWHNPRTEVLAGYVLAGHAQNGGTQKFSTLFPPSLTPDQLSELLAIQTNASTLYARRCSHHSIIECHQPTSTTYFIQGYRVRNTVELFSSAHPILLYTNLSDAIFAPGNENQIVHLGDLQDLLTNGTTSVLRTVQELYQIAYALLSNASNVDTALAGFVVTSPNRVLVDIALQLPELQIPAGVIIEVSLDVLPLTQTERNHVESFR